MRNMWKAPENAQKIGSVSVLLLPSVGHLCICCVWLSRRANKPLWQVCDHEDDVSGLVDYCNRKAEAINTTIEVRRRERRKHDDKRKAEMREYCQVGAILHTCWGYEQTNIEFYQIVARSGDRLTVRQIAGDWADTGWCQHAGKPIKDRFIGGPMTKMIGAGYVRISECRSAWPVEDGHTYRATSYA